MNYGYMKDGLANVAIHLVQECAEVTKEITKAQLYGWDSHHPHDLMVPPMPNYQRVRREIEDAKLMIHRLELAIDEYEKSI